MENRIQQRPYRQVADSLDFQLVRAKLKAYDGAAPEAVADFGIQLKEGKFAAEPAVRFGLAHAYLRSGNLGAAEAQLAELRRLKAVSSMVELLAAQLRSRGNDSPGAVRILRAAAGKYPQDRAVAYALAEALLADRRADEALKFIVADLQGHTTDFHMTGLQAKALAQLGKRLQQHRAQAEAYALQGQYLAAIEQLTLAQKSPDGDFFEYSQVDARLREIKALQAQEAKEAKERKR
jgi:predicted Zn-dependent protease